MADGTQVFEHIAWERRGPRLVTFPVGTGGPPAVPPTPAEPLAPGFRSQAIV